MNRTALRQRGRKAAVTHARDFGPQAKRCRSLPCAACTYLREPQRTPTEAHHEPPRSRGGEDRDTLPLCQIHHRIRHTHGASAFWSAIGLAPHDVVTAIRLGTPLPGTAWEHVPW